MNMDIQERDVRWQAERAEVYEKCRLAIVTGLQVVPTARRQAERNAIFRQCQTELDAVDAKWQINWRSER